jgi:mRNA-degrading endonuclease HigB of HigAB toxin-antitoxin module
LYGPTQISTSGKIGAGRIQRRSGQSDISGILRFTDTADSEEEIIDRMENVWRKEAQRIVNTLSFVTEQGIVLGEPYDPVPTDVPNQSTTDGVPQINSYILDISSDTYSNIQEQLETNGQLDRALRWYRLGKSTVTPEDKYVAFWTGLEASVDQESALTDDELEAYNRVQNGIEDLVYATDDYDEEEGELDDLKNSIKNNIGWAKKESIPDAIHRNIKHIVDDEDIPNVDGDSLRSKLSTLSHDRANVVHRGEEVENVREKAAYLELLLRRLIEDTISNPYSDLFPNKPETPDHSLRVSPDEWFRAIFEESDIELTRNEIRKRAFALSNELEESYGIHAEAYAGWNNPLTQTGEGESRAEDTFVYSKPKWLDAEKVRVLEYLYGAGAVPVDVISHNSGLDTDTVSETCEALTNTNLVNRVGDYFELSIDGKQWIKRGGDPACLVIEDEEALQ